MQVSYEIEFYGRLSLTFKISVALNRRQRMTLGFGGSSVLVLLVVLDVVCDHVCVNLVRYKNRK